MSSSDDGPLTRTVLPDDQQPGGAVKRPRPMRSLLVVLVVIGLLIGAIAIANRSGGSHEASGPDAPAATEGKAPGGKSDPTAPTGVAPVTSTTNGIPKGFAHTQQGAQSAAANYAVVLGSTQMFQRETRHRIVDSVYTPQAADLLNQQQDRAYSPEFLKKVGLNAKGEAPSGMNFVSRTVPVGTKVERYGGGGARVSVWCTALIGMAGNGSETPVRTDWFTYTLDLHWASGDWKVAKDTLNKGPAPVEGDVPASGAEEIAGAVKDFGGFTYAR
jgi:hypothetical protein